MWGFHSLTTAPGPLPVSTKGDFCQFRGNDLCSLSVLRIFNLIRRGIDYLTAAYPGVPLVWVDILQRLHWSDSVQGDIIVEGKRRRVNHFGRQKISALSGGHSLIHDIDHKTPGFYRRDGIHLSDVGLEMYLDGSRDKILSLL